MTTTAPVTKWIVQKPSFNTTANDQSPSIVVDSLNNTYVAYYTTGTTPGNTSSGGNDIVLFKLDSNGNNLWTVQSSSYNTGGSDTFATPTSIALAVDSSDNIYMAFQTTGTVPSDGDLVNPNVNTGSTDVAVAKFNSTNGSIIWVKQKSLFNTTSADLNPTIAVDSSANVYVAYHTSGAVAGKTSTGSSDIVVFKLNTNGTHQWTQQNSNFNSAGSDQSPTIDTDTNGFLYVAYTSSGNRPPLTLASGGQDIVVFKMDTATGATISWIKQDASFNTVNIDTFPSIAVSTGGNVYVAYPTTITGSAYDINIFKLNTSGTTQWLNTFGSFNPINPTDPFDDRVPKIALGPSDNLYVTWYTNGVVPSDSFNTNTRFGGYDIAVLGIDSNGTKIWLTQKTFFNTVVSEFFPAICVDTTGNVYITYTTTGTVTTVLDPNNINSGSGDIVVFKLGYPVCVGSDTEILMADGTIKLIQHIQRGDEVAANTSITKTYKVSDIPKTIHYPMNKINMCEFDTNCLENNVPNKPLIISTGHPIIHNSTRRSAHFFCDVPNVKMHYDTFIGDIFNIVDREIYLWDLQFDTIGSYVANGVTIQSRHPQSFISPLPKNMFHDISLFSDEIKDDDDPSYELPLLYSKF